MGAVGALEDYIYCLECGETHEQALKSAVINGALEGVTTGGTKWLGNVIENRIKARRATKESSRMVRVGRWMCRDEYDKMVKTGKVQESYSGITHVANPADYNAFYKQAKKGSVYVEFDVPLSSVKQRMYGRKF